MIDAYLQTRLSLGRTREDAGIPPGVSELELQAGFYRGDFGTSWVGTEGERIEVLHPGHWNREPGPDFCGARLRIGGQELSGDIEIDIHARDWETHGHGVNPSFGNVALHGFFRAGSRRFFTRNWENRQVPQALLAAPAVKERRGPGYTVLHTLDEESARWLVNAAGRYRLHRKRETFRRAAALCDVDEALFQSLATGLGYRNNKVPFLLVAQRAGLARAREKDGESLLFGLAGFLQAEYFDRGDEAERLYLGHLWREWWTVRDQETRLILPGPSWKLAALRPANHPHRRMGALAALTSDFGAIRAAVREANLGKFLRSLSTLKHPFWQTRWNLSSDSLPKAAALIGADRALDLAINAFLPALEEESKALDIMASLRGPSPSGKVRQAGQWITGSSGGFSSALAQQGLLQLYDDFFPEGPAVVLENFRRHSTPADSW